MVEQQVRVSHENATKWCVIALLVAGIAAAYANHFHNGFHFDDAHAIENNAAIRTLTNLWRFFCDPTTFSALPSNQSYRPLVSALLAIDYWVAGGLNPFVFHLSIFILFLLLILSLAFVIRYLLQTDGSSQTNGWLALAAVSCYALHPANADTINYIIAVSDIISTLGVVGSFAVYLAFPKLRRLYLFVIPAALSILAKPPAATFPLLFGIFGLLFPENGAGGQSGKDRAIFWLREIVPPFLICGATLLFVQHMTPRTWVAGAANTRNYLITQPYVTMLYFGTFFWPNNLSADYDLTPFTTTDDVRFWIGLGFIVVFLAGSITAAMHQRTRLIGFGLLWFLTALLPTSLFPLAETMNDHRTFFPYIGLAIAIAGVASPALRCRYWTGSRIAVGAAMLLVIPSAGYATWKRNEVWKTEESLWRDVTIKSPHNARGLMNYGVTLMAKGDFTPARDYFYRAKALAPRYPVLLINLAVAEDAARHLSIAEQYFREALQLGSSTPDSYTYYARWLLTQGRVAEAGLLIKKALELSPADVNAQQLLAQNRDKLLQASITPEYYLSLSLLYYNEGRYTESIQASHSALALRPDYAEAWNNIGAAQNQLGEYSEAAAACEQALRLNPQLELARNNLQFARTKMSQTGVSRP
jgi:tetratricopeptide (TPR) repeat protein